MCGWSHYSDHYSSQQGTQSSEFHAAERARISFTICFYIQQNNEPEAEEDKGEEVK
jgi:hypothetical protein